MAGVVSAFVILCYPFFFLLPTLNAEGPVPGQSGTTPGIEKIFIDRCNAFQKQNSVAFVNNPKNCTLLWEVFLNSFAKKDSCSINTSSYEAFLEEANHTATIKDKAMFWTSVYPFVYNFTASQPGKYVTILDLLSGFLLDGLTWCWNISKNDLDYDSCPFFLDCPYENEAVRSFWKANSKMFAGLASGEVFAMINGSTDVGAYTNRSLFYTVEVVAMRNPHITRMQAILVHNPGGPFRDYCYNGTLAALRQDITSKSIEFECIEDPPEVKQLQCQIYPQYAKYCSTSFTSASTSDTPASTSGAPAPAVLSNVAYQVIAINILWVVKVVGI